MRSAFPDVTITSRGSNIKIIGEKKEAKEVKARFELMVRLLKEHKELPLHSVEDIVKGENPLVNKLSTSGAGNYTIVHGRGGKAIKAKTVNQRRLIQSSE